MSGWPARVVGPEMFDVYMTANAIDPRVRRRFVAAGMLAAVASALALGSYLGGQRFSIHRVDAPHVDLDVLLASVVPTPPLAVDPPPPPDDPPPKPVDEVPSTVQPRAKPEGPEDVLERVTKRGPGPQDGPKDGPTGGTGVPGPGRPVVSGIPCPIPGTCKRDVQTIPRNTDNAHATPKVPLSHVRERLRFSPDPSRADLLRTVAGQRGQGGTSIVEFCIDTDGRVEDVRTKRSHGDRDVDRICREALTRWRFSPMAVRGKAQRTCSEMSFVIAFE